MRTSSLARKHDSRNMIQYAEFRYSPSGAVVSLASYDGDCPASETGVHQNNKAMCQYSENHEKLSTRLQKIEVGDLVMQLLNLRSHTSSSPSGDEDISGQQNRTAHIRKNKGMYRPNEIFSTENCGSGDKNQRAASNEVPAMTSLFTIRNTTSLPGLQIAAHIDILE